MRLSEQLEQDFKYLMKQVGVPIETLATVAAQLKQPEVAKRLNDVYAQMKSDTFHLIVLGRFKNGKSTFLNALLGSHTHPVPELGGSDGPLPMDDLPCTATLTRINYGEKPSVRVWKFDGKSEPWSLQKYLDQARVRADNEETYHFFRDIREFELTYPAELLKAGITLLDSPGTDDDPYASS